MGKRVMRQIRCKECTKRAANFAFLEAVIQLFNVIQRKKYIKYTLHKKTLIEVVIRYKHYLSLPLLSFPLLSFPLSSSFFVY